MITNKLLLDLSQLISHEIQKFEEYFASNLSSNVEIINTVIKYICKRKGKRFRPILCLLSSKICGEINENSYRSAALVEMIHVATLIHDDVVDDADIRRGWPSVHRIWKNKISILVGDYMFSKALTNVINIKDRDALSVLSKTAERLSQGEISQLEKSYKKEMSEEEYMEMVSDKTSSLFSASCLLGAISATENIDKRNALKRYGELLGTMFQIQDDLLDILGKEDTVGKPTMYDIKRNMMN